MGKKAMLGYFVNTEGKFLKINTEGETEAVALNPEFAYTLFNTRILKRMAGVLSVGLGEKLLLAGVGMALAFIIIFVVLPMAGYPVHIGKGLVQVAVNMPNAVTTTPPPGNFTVGG